MRRVLTSVLLTFLFLFFLTPLDVFAKVISVDKGIVTVAKDEIINDDLFIAGESVEIYGTVNGDVYAGGGTIRVDGTINGDLLAGGGSVYVSGRIRDDAYLGAGNINLNKATIGDSLITGGGNINVSKDSSVGGSLIGGGGTFSIFSPIKRNLILGSGNANINAQISGEARIGAGEISFGPDTKIGKDLYYALGEEGKEIRMSEGASISGLTKKYTPDYDTQRRLERAKNSTEGVFKSAKLATSVISFLGALLVGYLFLRFLPKALLVSSDFVTNSFWKSLGVGFLVSLVFFPALIILAITGIGLPLAGILFLLFLVNVYLSKFPVAFALGNWIKTRFNRKDFSPFVVFLTGLVVIYLAKMIWVIGLFVSLAVLWSGLGALILYWKSSVEAKK